jgi:YVTN family beta-propeller protein
VWARSSDGNVVYRIDARAHHVTQQIPVGASPEGIAFVNGDVWVANVLDGTSAASTPQRVAPSKRSASAPRPPG